MTVNIVCPTPPTDSAPTDVVLRLKNQTYPMQPVSPGSNRYTAAIPADQIVRGKLSVEVTCSGRDTPLSDTIGDIELFDPSGVIRDAGAGQPISGAKVTLFRVPDALPDTAAETRQCRTIDTRGPSSGVEPWDNVPDHTRSATDEEVVQPI